ncbi:hypothetical protein FQN54_002446 [Arachnomyces sp. PD_36]|nr:hypothetical protein FQN54_002446 [Arachnomyces sp. PD_36]
MANKAVETYSMEEPALWKSFGGVVQHRRVRDPRRRETADIIRFKPYHYKQNAKLKEALEKRAAEEGLTLEQYAAPWQRSLDRFKEMPTLITKPSLPRTPLEVSVFGMETRGELELGKAGGTARKVTGSRSNQTFDANAVKVVDFSACGMHAVALTSDNQILFWATLGRDSAPEGSSAGAEDDSGSISDGHFPGLSPFDSAPSAITADKFPPGTRFAQVATGDSTIFVLTETGLVYGWGQFQDSNGEFGFYLTPDDEVINLQENPMLIPELRDITKLSVGKNFCLALDANGRVFAFGTGDHGELGRRLVSRRRNTSLRPSLVELPKKVRIKSIHTGWNHAFAIDRDGGTWAWGLNNFAQTGVAEGAGEDSSADFIPQRVLVGLKMKMLDGGPHHSIGLCGESCFIWGRMHNAKVDPDISHTPLDDPGVMILDQGRSWSLLRPTRIPIRGCVFAAADTAQNIVIGSTGSIFSCVLSAAPRCRETPIGSGDIQFSRIDTGTEVCWAGAGGRHWFLASIPRGFVG